MIKSTIEYYEHRMAVDPAGDAWRTYWLGVRDRIENGQDEIEAKDRAMDTISRMYPQVLWGESK